MSAELVSRPAVHALIMAEERSRQAWRILAYGAQPARSHEVEGVNTLIDEAIAQLVKARAALNGTEAVEPL